jgi:hypothetical protein
MSAVPVQPVAVRRGLCSACRNDQFCIYPRNGLPILECGEFELCVGPAAAEAGKAASPSGNGSGRSLLFENDPANQLGLCANCEDRETCIYPKPEGGVWRCEEYR